jgi:hypothetical protein
MGITLTGCSPILPVAIDEEIDYTQEITLTWNEYSRLSYLLEWVIDIENDSSDTWNRPLNTDEQKWTFIFNILNDNYMDKYENPEEAVEKPYCPTLEDSFIPNNWDIHDWIFPVDKNVKVAYKKSDIDQILNDTIWNTLKDWSKIKQEWMILSWDEYLLFTYLYYGSDLIWNKWRTTRFEIDSIKQASEKDIEVKARYLDDALEDWEDINETECNLTYHISKNPWSFYGYTVNEYMYTWCKLDINYMAPDFPSELIYGMNEWISNDYVWLKKQFKSEELSIDLNNDWVEEFFRIWVDSPNWTQILWINWNDWYNFIYDFSGDIVDDYNELKDWLFTEMYFEDLDWDGNLEVVVVVWDKKNWLEAIEYRLKIIPNENPFVEIWHFYGKSYLEYDNDAHIIHAPYSDNWVCKTYDVSNDRVYKD